MDFCLLPKIGIENMSKNLNGKYNQKLLDRAKQSAIDALQPASKRAVNKIAEATGYLLGKIIAD